MAQHGFEFVSWRLRPGRGQLSFLGWTFHKAGANVSSSPRSVMTIIYMDADMHIAPALNAIQATTVTSGCPPRAAR